MKHCINSSVKKIMSLILLISCANSNAFIYLAQKYVKTLPNLRTQTLWLLSDLHVDNPADDLQVKVILDFAQQLKNNGYTVKFIVEDIAYHNSISLSHFSITETALQLPYIIKYNSPVTITNVCKQKGLNVCNIEFRRNEHDLLAKLPFTTQAYEQFLAAQQKIVQEINSYKDSDTLNDFYKDVIKEVKAPQLSVIELFINPDSKEMHRFVEIIKEQRGKSLQTNFYWDALITVLNEQIPSLHFLQNPSFYNIAGISLSLFSFCVQKLKYKKPSILTDSLLIAGGLCAYNGIKISLGQNSLYNQRKRLLEVAVGWWQKPLINARIMHQIYISPDQDHIFIAVGGGHIKKTIPVLEKIHYKQTGATNIRWKDGEKLPTDLQSFFDLYHPIPELRKKNKQFQNPKTYSAPVCLPRVQ